MFLHFDRQRMELQVVCSASETFVPGETTKELDEMVKQLKAKIEKFTVDEINPLMEQIQNKLQAENERLNPPNQ